MVNKKATRGGVQSPFRFAKASVTSLERLSPAFLRVTLGGPDLAAVGKPGRVLDQRVKLVFPTDDGTLANLDPSSSWEDWVDAASSERGHMRTYSVRNLDVQGGRTSLVVDFVLHGADDHAGPALRWALGARVGSPLLVYAPDRRNETDSGIEFYPGGASHSILVGDETALPAISSILEDPNLPSDVRIDAFVEVPEDSDVLDLALRGSRSIKWFPRRNASRGDLVTSHLLALLGANEETAPQHGANHDANATSLPQTPQTDDSTPTSDGANPWETSTYSNLEHCDPGSEDGRFDGMYFWIAGESRMVTTLRRHLVRELGVPRSKVAFMGYWKEGVAMRS